MEIAVNAVVSEVRDRGFDVHRWTHGSGMAKSLANKKQMTELEFLATRHLFYEDLC